MPGSLHLEPTRLSATTTLLEFAALGDGIGLFVLVRTCGRDQCANGIFKADAHTHAKVLDSFPCSALASQQNGVGSSRSTKSKLIEGQDLTPSLENALLRSLSETEGSDSEFWDGGQPDIIGDSADLDDDF